MAVSVLTDLPCQAADTVLAVKNGTDVGACFATLIHFYRSKGMPRFDGTGPQGQGNIGGLRSGRCEFGSNLPGQGLGGRQRQRNGANQDRSFVGSCIEHLQSKIQGLQARLAELKAQSGE